MRRSSMDGRTNQERAIRDSVTHAGKKENRNRENQFLYDQRLLFMEIYVCRNG